MPKFNSMKELKLYKQALKESRKELKSDYVDNDLSIMGIAQMFMGSSLMPKVLGLVTGRNKSKAKSKAISLKTNIEDNTPKSSSFLLKAGKTVGIAALKIIAVNLVIWGGKKAVQKIKERKIIREVKRKKEALINDIVQKSTK